MKKSALAILALCFYSSFAAAGNWSSGGGSMARDANNPWFLGNVTTIRYCIAGDFNNFSATPALVDQIIQAAAAYWKDQFTFARYTVFPEILRTASQDFVRYDCPSRIEDALATMDIVFQFGVLNDEQREFIREPREYAAITVRTDYDPVGLRGKGFIYFSPDSGPLRFNSSILKPDAWSRQRGSALFQVMLHELGHVFGLPHFGNAGETMHSGFPEFALTNLTSDLVFRYPPNVFRPATYGMYCDSVYLNAGFIKFFYLEPTTPCTELVIAEDTAEVLYKTSPGAPTKSAGTVNFSMESSRKRQEVSQIVSYAITSAQTVLPISGDQFRLSGVPGPGIAVVARTGTFRSSLREATREVHVEVSSKAIKIGGILNGELFYNLPEQ